VRRPKPKIDLSKTPVRRKPSLDFSVTGLVYCSMMMFMGLAAINTQANLLFGVFGLMIGILLVSGIISRLVLRGLRVHRELPDGCVVGQPTNLTYEFVNNKKFWPSLSVTLAELDGVEAFVKQPQTYMLHAAGATNAVVPTEVVPKRRGLHQLDRYQLSTSFPFGFIKRAVERRHAETLLVYPAIAKVDPRVLALCRSSETSGSMMRPKRGGDDEFYGVKEYRQGENPRRIYWRRSARTGVLVSKEMTRVSPPKLLLLIDTFSRPGQREDLTDVERVIAMAASLANHALEQGLQLGAYTWSGDWVGLHPNRGKRHRRDVLALLARLPVNQAHSLQDLLDNAEQFVKSGSTPVLFTPRDVQLGLGDHLRTGMLVVSAVSQQSRNWFRFEETVDFAHTMPEEPPAVVT